ncbi:hypothetical protein JHK82_053204 [Glycine max]|nr:hypothetical protein JHK85_053917 [Glycine max]KAG5085807.1 hypothetical protein JHK82_053204 [Glycine max]
MVVGGGLEPSKKVSHLRLDRVLTMGERERLWGMFYRGPTVGAKCTYQNPQLFHVKVDVAKVGSKISNVGLRVPFVKRTREMTCKTKDFDAQIIFGRNGEAHISLLDYDPPLVEYVLNSDNAKVVLRTWTNYLLIEILASSRNYGPFFDNIEVGVLGPVQLVAAVGDYDYDDEIVKDLSKKKNGVIKLDSTGIMTCITTMRTALKHGIQMTTFKSPIGDDPVVVDLSGLGKGYAWVNGKSVGRYHVPRSFLRDDDQNTLVLFEEMGRHPFDVKFLTATFGKVCANAYEGHTLELACNKNQVISEIKFASFSLSKGERGSFQKGNCESSEALSLIKAQCIGKDKCSIQVSERTLGPTGCRVAENRRLAVEAVYDIKVSDEGRKHWVLICALGNHLGLSFILVVMVLT